MLQAENVILSDSEGKELLVEGFPFNSMRHLAPYYTLYHWKRAAIIIWP